MPELTSPLNHQELEKLLDELGSEVSTTASPIDKALALARRMQRRGTQLQTSQERRQQAELERMVQSEHDRATLTQLTDQAFRAHTPRRVADQITHVLDVQGVPRFFTALDRAMLRGFQSFGAFLPSVSVPMVKGKMRDETANVILPAEKDLLARYLDKRRDVGLRMNVNFLGEALLGEDDARKRLESYLQALQMPELEVISVKVSTIYSQITPISRRHATKILCDRMELLYRAAARETYTRHDGTETAKFVYLDMEEYRDLQITVDTFIETLSRPGLERVNAGIALQAYIPDSYEAQLRITEWARERVESGGSPVTIRLVKGANMEMERVESSIAGWPQAPFERKVDTDANYKRMLETALRPENAAAVGIGVASHNLFEVAYALVLASERGLLDRIQIEMLEGMANHQRRALSELAPNVLLYAPATYKESFVNAIGYLIRRLDENTGPENFLRHAFKLEVDSAQWKRLEATFTSSFERMESLPQTARRSQDRRTEVRRDEYAPLSIEDFVNEPDTDFSRACNLEWAESIIESWRSRHSEDAADIAPVIAGEERRGGDRRIVESMDPSRPGCVVARVTLADDADIDAALECAARDASGWRSMDDRERGTLLARVADELRMARADLIGAAIADGGKLITESDPEVSEAIDFVNYYAASARELRLLDTVDVSPRGVVAVVPPWNFPIAIPCGGVSAALAAGNTVILKPASDAILVAHELCKCFWRAGVPREALQFAPCSGRVGGARLVASDLVDAVILTGGTDTALRMLEAKPDLNLLAETGGKNATIVTAMSDREQAIKHVLHSAFGHAGQKCSATSLLILEGEVYDDPSFRETLCDAARSIRVGSAWTLDTRMGPMIKAPSGDLERALKELEKGESWALMPRRQDDNPALYSPGIKWGVARGSYTHLTEFFGPVLAVMRADNLDDAIDMVNETGYGLTSGIETLDAREQELWRDDIRAGNLYINRGTTGAVVLRQPFGGMGKSAFGPGIKVGGPNYVAQLMRVEDRDDAAERNHEIESERLADFYQRVAALDPTSLDEPQRVRLLRAITSYDYWRAMEFGREHDSVRVIGQDNIRRYLPDSALRVRAHRDDDAFEVLARACAAAAAGCRVTVSSPGGSALPAVELLDRLTRTWAADIEFVEESDAELLAIVEAEQATRLRYAHPSRVPDPVRKAASRRGIHVADVPVLAEGRFELLWYLVEQSISCDYHRYGNLGERASEARRPLPPA